MNIVRITVEEMIAQEWKAQECDLIGGWCVVLASDPPCSAGHEVGSFLGQEIAEHVVHFHNVVAFA